MDKSGANKSAINQIIADKNSSSQFSISIFR
jgi:hypothetical protein